jgi:hypothetical protein
MPVADCPLCGRSRLPLRKNGTFRSHPNHAGNRCPGTGRRPLTWVDKRMPGCHECWDWITQPLMAEAIASVGIETGGIDVKRLVGAYHMNKHKEE